MYRVAFLLGLNQCFLKELEPQINKSMKWADVHELLAKNGILCEKNTYGLVFTQNQEKYEKASSIGQFWSLKSLENHLGKTFRKPRANITETFSNSKETQKSRKELLKERLKKQPTESTAEWATRNLEHYNSFKTKNDYVLKQISFFAKVQVESAYFVQKRQNYKDLSAFCREIKFKRHAPEELRQAVNLGFDLIALESSSKFATNLTELEKIKASY